MKKSRRKNDLLSGFPVLENIHIYYKGKKLEYGVIEE